MDNGSEAGMEMLRQEAVPDEAIQMVTNKTTQTFASQCKEEFGFYSKGDGSH